MQTLKGLYLPRALPIAQMFESKFLYDQPNTGSMKVTDGYQRKVHGYQRLITRQIVNWVESILVTLGVDMCLDVHILDKNKPQWLQVENIPDSKHIADQEKYSRTYLPDFVCAICILHISYWVVSRIIALGRQILLSWSYRSTQHFQRSSNWSTRVGKFDQRFSISIICFTNKVFLFYEQPLNQSFDHHFLGQDNLVVPESPEYS